MTLQKIKNKNELKSLNNFQMYDFAFFKSLNYEQPLRLLLLLWLWLPGEQQ